MAILFKQSCQSASSATNGANIDAMLRKKNTDWKETYMFQSMLGAGGQAEAQSIKAEIVTSML